MKNIIKEIIEMKHVIDLIKKEGDIMDCDFYIINKNKVIFEYSEYGEFDKIVEGEIKFDMKNGLTMCVDKPDYRIGENAYLYVADYFNIMNWS